MKKRSIIITSVILLFCVGFFGYNMIKSAMSKEMYKMLGTLGTPAVTASAEPTVSTEPTADALLGDEAAPLDGEQNSGGEQKANNNGGGNTLSPSVKSEIDKAIADARSRLSGGEISEILSMQSGGFTAKEKKRIKEIVYSKFSSGEIAYYRDLYNKYGDKYNG